MKRKHKQILIIWVGLLAGLLIFRGGWMTYAGLLIFFLDLGLVWWLLRCPHCGFPLGLNELFTPYCHSCGEPLDPLFPPQQHTAGFRRR